MTLVFVVEGNRVLLGFKKRGFGANRWNGFGGKVHEHESIEIAAKRELLEECGLVWQEGEAGGMVSFTFEHDDKVPTVYLFRATAVSGEPKETDEMRPQWFTFDELPLESMWPSDRFWLSEFLRGQTVRGKVHFQDEQTVLSHQISFS